MSLGKDLFEPLLIVADKIRECKECQIFTKKEMNSTLARFKFHKKQIRNKEIENLENEQSSHTKHPRGK